MNARDCDYFAEHLLELVPSSELHTDPHCAHLAGCPVCSTRWEAACRHATMLRGISGDVPAELAAPAFFEAILERVAADSAATIGEAELHASLASVAPPADLDWAPRVLADLESGPVAEGLRAMRPAPVPGWLWSRVRGDLRRSQASHRAMRRSRRVWRVAAAAAAVVVVGLVVRDLGLGSADQRNSQDIHVVFQQADQPLHASFSPSTLLRGE